MERTPSSTVDLAPAAAELGLVRRYYICPVQEADPDHLIIAHPSRYRVVGFCFQRTLDDSEEAYIDLTLQCGEVMRRLRFFGPRRVSIEEGFPDGAGMYIADVRQRGLEGLGVHVGDYEASRGAIEFWARTVVDLDAPNTRSA